MAKCVIDGPPEVFHLLDEELAVLVGLARPSRRHAFTTSIGAFVDRKDYDLAAFDQVFGWSGRARISRDHGR